MAAPCPHRVTRGPRIRSESQTWPCHRSMSQCRFLGPFPKSWLSGPGPRNEHFKRAPLGANTPPGSGSFTRPQSIWPRGRMPQPRRQRSSLLAIPEVGESEVRGPADSLTSVSAAACGLADHAHRALAWRKAPGSSGGLFMRPPTTQSPWGPTSPVTLEGKSKQTWGDTNPHGC